MKPHSGNWIGTFVTHDGRAVQVAIKFAFHDNGSLQGSFTVYGDLSHWHGPTSGEIDEGGYSPFGSIHFEEEEDESNVGSATFDGRYEAPERHVGVIWGTALITKKDKTERGTLALVYAQPPLNVSGGVWGE